MADEEWVSAYRAQAMLLTAGGGSPDAIVSWASVGKIRSQYSQASSRGRHREVDGAPNLPKAFWQCLKKDPQAQSDWTAGVFSAEVNTTPFGPPVHEIWTLSGVTFNASDLNHCFDEVGLHKPLDGAAGQLIQTLSPAQDRIPQAERAAAKAGRPRQEDHWVDFAAALALVAHLEDTKTLSKQASIYAKAREALQAAGRPVLDEKTVRPLLRSAVNWIAAGNIPPVGNN